MAAFVQLLMNNSTQQRRKSMQNNGCCNHGQQLLEPANIATMLILLGWPQQRSAAS